MAFFKNAGGSRIKFRNQIANLYKLSPIQCEGIYQ